MHTFIYCSRVGDRSLPKVWSKLSSNIRSSPLIFILLPTYASCLSFSFFFLVSSGERVLWKRFEEPEKRYKNCSIIFIAGRGTVLTGRVERGKIKKGSDVEIQGYGQKFKSVVTGMETFHKTLEDAQAGDVTGLLVRGLKRDDAKRGMVSALVKRLTVLASREEEELNLVFIINLRGVNFNSIRSHF